MEYNCQATGATLALPLWLALKAEALADRPCCRSQRPATGRTARAVQMTGGR